MIGKLQRVPLREVWKSELDFTRWLQENIDVLNDVLDLSLSGAEREQPAGQFSVDLVAEDDAGNPAVIENQLEKSNHDHLGKIITYLTALGAKAAIWIVADPRPDHVGAISWLNESSQAAFYLVKVEAVKIGNSAAAPLLTLIVGPSEESRGVGEIKKGLGERDAIRHQFWTELLEKAKGRTSLFANVSAGQRQWIETPAYKRGLKWAYVARQHDANVELYIDRGKDTGDENKAIFDMLAVSKDVIETAFGESLEWQRLETRRACQIKKDIELGGYLDQDRWAEVQDAMIEAMIRLEKALAPRIKKLQI